MTIPDWPVYERPRERLMTQGSNALSDAELLAIMLGKGIKGKTALDLARELIQYYQGLPQLLEADLKSMTQHAGLGQTKYCLLQAALELSRRYLQSTIAHGPLVQGAHQAKEFLIASLRHYQHEVFACLFLDSQHHLICFEPLFHGTINCASVYPREVVKRALFHNAASVIFAHNHPSGTAEPSDDDCQVTEQLNQILSVIDVQVIDHFIIGATQAFSLAERGLF